MKHVLSFLYSLLITALTALVTEMLKPVPALYSVGIWALVPLSGAIGAYIAVRRGVNAYLAWLVPPICAALVPLIASMGYLPPAGRVLMCAFISIVGAAAGDTGNSFDKKRRRK
ncbi:MAG: hypothetical protein IJC48_08150 [Clostridia bacterium]|nr:hypothetical protein [Clostridia bacterium]